MEAHGVDSHQHLMDVMHNILLFFGIAGLAVPLLQRVKISPVLGYLICGMFIGPFGLSLYAEAYPWLHYITINETDTVTMLGELGIIALLFMIGLELSFQRLKELRHYIFGLGSSQILLCGIAIFLIAKYFDNSVEASVLIGASFALSSTAIVMKLLEEQKLTGQAIGTLCFSILLMQDLAVIPILVLASSLSGDANTSILSALGTALALGALTVTVIYLLGKKVLTPLLHSISGSTSAERLTAFVVFIVIACAAITQASGLSLALGAFMAGLLIAETEYKHEIEVIISPLKGMLLGIFFLSIGMMINLAEIMRYPGLLSMSVVGIYFLKATIIFGLCLLFRLPAKQSGEAAVYLAQPGEFALMILGVAMATNLMPASDVQFFLLVTVLAMMLTPFLFKAAPYAGRFAQRYLGEKEGADSSTSFSTNEDAVVIAGFGRVGQLIGETLDKQGIPYIAFDLDSKRVKALKKQGFRVYYGDARKNEIWKHLIGDGIKSAVIAIDNHEATQSILRSLRRKFPILPVIIRSKDADHQNMLYDEGANHVVAETLESSLRIAQLLLEKLGSSREDARNIIEHTRVPEAE